MTSVEKRSFASPDEVRTPDKARVEVVDFGDAKVGRATFQPGWRWSESIKPVVGGDSCQARHSGIVISGRMHIVHEDGAEADIEPGDVFRIQPGHDAWVLGEEPAVTVEFESTTAATFAKP